MLTKSNFGKRKENNDIKGIRRIYKNHVHIKTAK